MDSVIDDLALNKLPNFQNDAGAHRDSLYDLGRGPVHEYRYFKSRTNKQEKHYDQSD